MSLRCAHRRNCDDKKRLFVREIGICYSPFENVSTPPNRRQVLDMARNSKVYDSLYIKADWTGIF